MFEELFTESAHQVMIMAAEATYQLRHSAIGTEHILIDAAEVKKMLNKDSERLQVIFVTVNPERDTPEVLRAYMTAFDPSFIALRGSSEQLAKVAEDFKVYYRKVPTGSSYTMDHTAHSYVFDPQGRLRLALRHEQTPQDYAHDISLLLKASD